MGNSISTSVLFSQFTLRSVVLPARVSRAKNLYDYFRGPSLSLKESQAGA